jgi:hypothetical protein
MAIMFLETAVITKLTGQPLTMLTSGNIVTKQIMLPAQRRGARSSGSFDLNRIRGVPAAAANSQKAAVSSLHTCTT